MSSPYPERFNEAISNLRAAAGETAFSLNLIAEVEPPRPAPLMREPTPAESIAQAVAVAKVTDVAADRLSILRAVVSVIDDPLNGAIKRRAESDRRWALSTIRDEVATDRRYSELTATTISRASSAVARADVRDVEKILAAARRRDADMGSQRPDVMQSLLTDLQRKLDAARQLRLARDQWRERVGSFRVYRRAVAPVFEVLEKAQRSLDDIKRLAGSEPEALVTLDARLGDGLRFLGLVSVPDQLKSSHALLQSALNLADHAVKMRREAVLTGELKFAWDASSSAAGSMMLLVKAQEEMDATLSGPQLR